MAQLLSRSTSMTQASGGPGPAQILPRHSSGIPMYPGQSHTDPSEFSTQGHSPLMTLRSQAASLARSSTTDLQRPVSTSDAPASSPDAAPKQAYPQSLQSLSPSAIETAKIPSGARRGSDMFSLPSPGHAHSLSLELAGGQMQSATTSNLGRPRVSAGAPPYHLPSPEKAPLGTIPEIPGSSAAGTPCGPSIASTPRTSVAFPAAQAAVPSASSQSAAHNSMRRASTAAGETSSIGKLRCCPQRDAVPACAKLQQLQYAFLERVEITPCGIFASPWT